MDYRKYTGRLSLEFKKNDDQTYLASQYYKLPLQVLPPHYQDADGTAFVYLLNPSGGVMQKDRLLIELSLGKSASVVATTPASNKFYKMEDDSAVVDNIFTLEEDSVLEYMPEHSVPFAGTSSVQNNIFYLKNSSVLIATDAITSGRKARGEKFEYERFCSKTKIYLDDKIILYDCMDIRPECDKIDSIGVLEENDIIAGLYLYKKGCAEEIREALMNNLITFGTMRIGITAVTDDLVVIRLLGTGVLNLKDSVTHIWGVCRKVMLNKDSVRLRKY